MHVYLNNTVKAISESVRFDSSEAAPKEDMPFGEGARDCLLHYLNLASSLGFQTVNYDNYAGEVIYGSGEEFAILSHLDVVPAGHGWTKDPFGGTVDETRIWGRGTTDDKGPTFAVLYALKALKDRGFVPKKQIRLIVGCNEENGWACIEHYKKCRPLPETGFSPDGNFPVIYAEKGILQIRLHYPVGDYLMRYLRGGERANMVCDSCSTRPLSLNRTRAEELGLEYRAGKLWSSGKVAHASTPQAGVNAILPILKYYEKDNGIQRIIADLFEDRHRLTSYTDGTGALTMSPDVIRYRQGDLSVVVDIRYPATMPSEQIFSLVGRFQVPYETLNHQLPLNNSRKSELVTTLARVYEECTGKDGTPIAIGGGTYARAIKNGAAFGPEAEGDEPVAHQADEFITIERVDLLLRVYERAIEQLTK